jgi:hypothetical protein
MAGSGAFRLLRLGAWGLLAALLGVPGGSAPVAAQTAEPLVWRDVLFTVGLRSEITLSTKRDLDFQSFEVEADLGLTSDLGPGRFEVLGRARRDLRYDFDHSFEEATGGEGRSQLELREMTWTVAGDSTDWSLGRKLVTWGRADGLRLLDVVNPLDFREFVFEDFSRSKIPLWMVERRHYFGSGDLQLLVIPEYRSNRLAPLGTPFYDGFNDPARAEDLPGDAPDDFSRDGLEGAVQLSGRWGRADVSLNYFYGHADDPTVELVPSRTPLGPLVEARKAWDRVHLAGGSFAVPVGNWLVRGEGAWVDGRRFPVPDSLLLPVLDADPSSRGVVEANQLQVLAGLDRNFNWTFLSFQHYVDRLGDTPFPTRRERQIDVTTGFLRREWRNGAIRGELLSFYVWDEGVWLHKPLLSYQVSDLLTLTAGATLTDGPRDTFFGQFQAADRLLLILEYDL